ncbi:daunorubicin C-13 ketoreductase [Stachybotrys elegans]|uniref:Daunorubicin C-13 ketoreductase n=1 Tax=Stachybotrys elegans TaxID=80388 RepID=A0A8K0SME3_9HYPO|nr:daunorubicin C-13 ketoreductase [Stachybotrys elegans]
MAKEWSPESLPDLSGSVALVTGGSAGIGLDTARHLALRGARVYFTAMTAAEATSVRETVLAENVSISSAQFIPLVFDLTDLASIAKLVDDVKANEDKLHILVNNAAIVPFSYELTKNGWERAMATAHVGHFALTNWLMPLLKNAAEDPKADVRIISVASNVNYEILPAKFPLDYTSPEILTGKYPYTPWQHRLLQLIMTTKHMFLYAMSKLANVMFAKELQRRLDEQGSSILSISLHPGLVGTEFMMELWVSWIHPFLTRSFWSSDKGAHHTLMVAADPSIRARAEEVKGQYLEPNGKLVLAHPISRDENQVRGFWDVTTEALNETLAEQGLPVLLDW